MSLLVGAPSPRTLPPVAGQTVSQGQSFATLSSVVKKLPLARVCPTDFLRTPFSGPWGFYSHMHAGCALSDRSNGYNIKGGMEGRWRRQKGGACSVGDTSHWAKCHQHQFPLRHVSGCHYRLPVSLMLSPVSTSMFLSRGRNVHDSMCFEADYSNPFANSFHLFIADDSGGLHARKLSLIWVAYWAPNVPEGVHFL